MTHSGTLARPALAAGATQGRRIDALRLALIAVVLTYIWRVQDLIPGLAPLKIPTVATLLTIILLVLDKRVARQAMTASRHRLWRLIPWFAMVAFGSALFSIALGSSLNFLAKVLLPSLALALVVPVTIFTPRNARILAAVQVAGALLYCVIVLSEFHVGADGRLAKLVYYDANDLGLLLVCTLPVAGHFVRHARMPVLRGLAAAAVLMFVFTIVRTGSRGAFLGLLAVSLYTIFRFRGGSAPARVGMVATMVLVLVVGAGDRYWDMMATILNPTADYNWAGQSEGGRMSIWKRGLGYLWARPITGVGVGAFPVAEGTMNEFSRRQEYGMGVKWSAAHNSFMQVAAELGVAGFVLFIWMLMRAFLTATRLARDAFARHGPEDAANGELAQAHGVALIGYAVCGFFLSQAYGPYLYFVIGIIIGLDVSMRAEWMQDTSRSAGALARGARHWRMARST